MFNILVDFKLVKKIKIEKLGLTFRNLNLKEKEMILNQINNIYIKNRKLINYCIKNYSKEDELKLSVDLLKYDDQVRQIVMFCFLGYKSGFSFNTPRTINKILENILIIDVKKDILLEYIEEVNITKVISNILSLYDIYSTDIKFNKKVRLDYSYILTDNILNPKEKDYDLNLVMNVLMSYEKKSMKKMTELSENYLLQLKEFFSKLTKVEIRRFLNIIDLFYSDHIMIQNKIINNVTLSEAILIKENEDIKSNYILKAGLILKHYTNGSQILNKFIKDYLNYCYDIRSAIVHGNEEKILSIYNSAVQKNKYIKELAKDDANTYINKKIKALHLANLMSVIVNRAIIKYWIENPSIVSYMKN